MSNQKSAKITKIFILSGFLLFVLLLVSINFPVSTSINEVSADASTAGLVGHWAFDEGSGTVANDTSGNGNNGTINGATWTAGKVGSGALQFDGSNDYVQLANAINFTATTTVALWLNPSGTSTFVSPVISAAYNNNAFGLNFGGNSNGRITWAQNGEGGYILSPNTWTFVVAIFSGVSGNWQVSWYKNGVFDSTTLSTTVLNPLQIRYIGGYRNGQTVPFKIDEARIYNRALSASEILDIYNDTGSIPPPPPTPVNGFCGTTVNTCTAGTFSDVADTSTDYLWTCLGSDGGANASCSLPIPPADTQAPTVPTNLIATAVSSSQINLAWTASTDNVAVTGYKIYRGEVQVGTSATNSYSDTGLSPSTTYSYTVSAYDAAGNNSAQSVAANATTQASGNGGGIINVGPADCSASAINAAINTASDGDTILLTCTGSVTWTSMVTIPNTKGITLNGGGTNTPKSSASFPLTIVSVQSPAVRIIAGTNNSLSRITGFKFQNSGTAGDAGFLNVTGQGVGKNGLGAFRIDNNYLDQISGAVIVKVLSNGGPLYGVIDNNTMHNAWRASGQDYGPYGIQVWNGWHGADGCWGRDGWTNPFNFGDANFVFLEDNLFENTSTSPNRYMRHYISAELGGRFVARYNDFNVMVQSPGGNRTDLIDGHGYCLANSNGVGTRGAEVYHNTFSGSQMGRLIMPRGGTWLIYDNIFNNLGSWASPIWLMEYRAGNSGMYGQCSQTSPCSSVWYPYVTDSPSRYPLEQQVSGTYVWNNLFGGVSQSPVVDGRGFQTFYIQPGRDYFVSASKPAALSTYAPHTYPHPLRNESITPIDTTPPSAPTGVMVQ